MICLPACLRVLFLFSMFSAVSSSENSKKKTYAGYKIIEALIRNDNDKWFIRELNHNGLIRLLGPHVVLGAPGEQTHAAALVSPENWNSVQAKFTEEGIPYNILVKDFQKHIEESSGPKKKKKRRISREVERQHSDQLSKYHSFTEIEDYLTKVEKSLPKIIQLSKFGQTTEGRALHAVHIGKHGGKHPKPVIMVDAGIHAREWITVSSALCLINHLASHYEVDPFLQQFHWVIMPVINADGYAFTTNTTHGDRLWRKTRSKPVNSGLFGDKPDCLGVDPNRNWGSHWGEKGVQRYNACTEVYAGPHPFSEPEVAALSDLVEYHREAVVLHVSLHAFSQVMLSPFGYKAGKPADYRLQATVMKAGVNAIHAKSGYKYKFGSIYDTMYAASGSSIDFFYQGLGIKHTYVIELRDTGKFGFVLNEKEILPTGEEAIAAIIAMAKEAHRTETVPPRYRSDT